MKKPAMFKTVLCMLLLSVLSVVAQEKPVVHLVKSYVEASNTLSASKQINSVLSLFDDKYKNNTSFIGLSGVVKNSNYNFEEFSEQLLANMTDKSYDFQMTITDIVFESQKEKSGAVSALVAFEAKIDGKIAEKGTMLMNIVAAKVRGDWKIVQNNTVRVSEGSEIGNCVCYLFSKGSAAFTAETYYPSGAEYDKEYQSFRLGTIDGMRVIKGNDTTYTWDENGNVFDGKHKIGKAMSSQEAVQKVLTYIYTKACTTIDFN